MSLINDALRKAQRQRSGGGNEVSATGDGPHAGPELRRSPRASRNALLVGAGLLGGASLVVIVVALLPRRPTAPPAVQPSSSAAVAVAPLRLAPADPIVLTVPAPSPPSTPIQPEAPVAAAPPSLELATASAPPKPPSAPIPPTEPSAPGARLAAAVDAFRVAGIRAAGTDSKVLMNDRVFRVGDLVDRELGIRLTGATANSLTFSDATGASYTRYF